MPTSVPSRTPMTFEMGLNIRTFRGVRGMTREALAKESGVGMRTLARLEAGDDCLLTTLERIARALDVTVGELIHGREAEL